MEQANERLSVDVDSMSIQWQLLMYAKPERESAVQCETYSRVHVAKGLWTYQNKLN